MPPEVLDQSTERVIWTFHVTGDADKVWLTSEGRTAYPGDVPAGTWTIMAFFGAQATATGSVTLSAGDSVTIHCSAQFEACKVR